MYYASGISLHIYDPDIMQQVLLGDRLVSDNDATLVRMFDLVALVDFGVPNVSIVIDNFKLLRVAGMYVMDVLRYFQIPFDPIRGDLFSAGECTLIKIVEGSTIDQYEGGGNLGIVDLRRFRRGEFSPSLVIDKQHVSCYTEPYEYSDCVHVAQHGDDDN
jgi:hypothetical protein